MKYVDGYIIPIKKKNVKAYLKMAALGRKMWKKYGALDYKECVGNDLKNNWGRPFPKLLKLKANETVIFAYILYKSKAHRDQVNAKVMKEMDKNNQADEFAKNPPFNMKLMTMGGFTADVS